MKALVRLIVIAVVVAGLGTTASAALVAGTIPAGATNEFIGDVAGTVAGNPIGGYYGAQLYLVGGPVNITAQWFGGEAGFNNEFQWDGTTVFTHPGGDTTGGTPDSTFVAPLVSSGLLPFSFLVDGGPGSVVNGTNPDNEGTEPNFFVTFYDLQNALSYPGNTAAGGPASGQFVWIFFDDGGGANDDNHDDMVIKLSITGGEFTAVPEPGSMILLGSGLAAMWMRRRRS